MGECSGGWSVCSTCTLASYQCGLGSIPVWSQIIWRHTCKWEGPFISCLSYVPPWVGMLSHWPSLPTSTNPIRGTLKIPQHLSKRAGESPWCWHPVPILDVLDMLITWIPADEERLCGNAAVIIVINVIIVIIIKLLFIYVSCMAFSCTEGNSPQHTMLWISLGTHGIFIILISLLSLSLSLLFLLLSLLLSWWSSLSLLLLLLLLLLFKILLLLLGTCKRLSMFHWLSSWQMMRSSFWRIWSVKKLTD